MPQVISATPPAFVYGGSHIGVLKYVLPVTPAWLTDRFVIVRSSYALLFFTWTKRR